MNNLQDGTTSSESAPSIALGFQALVVNDWLRNQLLGYFDLT